MSEFRNTFPLGHWMAAETIEDVLSIRILERGSAVEGPYVVETPAGQVLCAESVDELMERLR